MIVLQAKPLHLFYIIIITCNHTKCAQIVHAIVFMNKSELEPNKYVFSKLPFLFLPTHEYTATVCRLLRDCRCQNK